MDELSKVYIIKEKKEKKRKNVNRNQKCF